MARRRSPSRISNFLSAHLCLAAIASACASPTGTPIDAGADSASLSRSLVILERGEPGSLSLKPLVGASGEAQGRIEEVFNATMELKNERGATLPYLAEALPQLHTETWRVLPDGQMETAYRLRSGLTWHDGAPFSADDFVFAWQVYATPTFGGSTSGAIGQMSDVRAADAHTVLINWRRPYADAAALGTGLPPLPRHLLESPFHELESQAFANLPFWTNEYVGLGPYRLERREPGIALEGVAFPGNALGRAHIQRIRVVFMGDPNTALANLLTGEAHFVDQYLLWYQEGETLRREWAARGGGGTVIFTPTLIRIAQVQLRPEFANPREMLDVRVRQAVAHAFDRPTLMEIMTGGYGAAAPALTHPGSDVFPAVDRAIFKYPYDPRAAQRLLAEAGLVRGRDGMYARPSGDQFKVDISYLEGAANERETAINVDILAKAAISATGTVFPVAQFGDAAARARFTGLSVGGVANLQGYAIASVPGPENRWRGSNRGGWVNEEYDRLWNAFNSTLDPDERVRQTADMERVFSQDVPAIPLYYTPVVDAFVASLEGPTARMSPEAGRSLAQIYRWRWKE